MKAKSIVSTSLFLFVGASLACLVWSETRSSSVDQPSADAPGAVAPAPKDVTTAPGQKDKVDSAVSHKVIAYYFHRTARCKKCLTIEEYAREALIDAFPEAVESGRLEWHAIDIEQPEHEHFAMDYELVSSSLVLVNIVDGKQTDWRLLGDVWDLVNDKLRFQAYVEGKALLYLEEEEP